MTSETREAESAGPTPVERARSARLMNLIGKEIAASGGAIPFERYMELALYAPALGYYEASTDIFGARGDFVTAPELSPLFGACVARQVAEVLQGLGGGDVVEVGAGTGTLAATVIGELAALGAPLERYVIVERSASLRDRQAARLGANQETAVPVVWLDDFPDDGVRGVILANELLDALPVCRFRTENGTPRECFVGLDDDGFRWTVDAAERDPFRAAAARSLPPLADGYESELGLAQPAWLRRAAASLARGVVLLLDYGYPRRELYHPQRTSGTLTCHYRHQAHGDPLILTGLQDISAHVDFTAMAEEAVAAGLSLAGFATQADFLLRLGLLDLAGTLDPRSAAYVAAAGAIRRLTLPGEMGEAVKVMALSRDYTVPLRGFGGRGLRERL